MKLLKSVLSTERNIPKVIGFVVEGKEREFGGFGDSTVQQTINLNWLFARGFSNGQISAVEVGGNKSIVEKGKFKLTNLKLALYNQQSHNFVDIPNTITLVTRFIQDNRVVGFEVVIGDCYKGKLKYNDVVNLARWVKPTNFIVKTSERRKSFIAGKGIKLSSLNQVELPGDRAKAKRVKAPELKDETKEVSVDFENDFDKDLLGLYQFVDMNKGYIVNLPSEKYVPRGDTVSETGNDFVPLGIGEVAYPKIKYDNKKLNATLMFRKLGIVNLDIDGDKTSINSFVYRSKNIIADGSNYIERLGILLNQGEAQQLGKIYGASLGITEINERGVVEPINAMLGTQGYKLYRLETSKLNIMNKKAAEKSILNIEQLYDVIEKYSILRLKYKYLSPTSGLLKTLRGKLGNDEEYNRCVGKGIMPSFKMYSSEMLEILKENGIDIYSGAYTKISNVTNNKAKGSSGNIEIEVDYRLRNIDIDKITYKDMCNQTKELPDEINKLREQMAEIEASKGLQDAISYAWLCYKEIETKLEDVKGVLWKHKYAMQLLNNSNIHSHDVKYWLIDNKSRAKASVYNCILPGKYENLKLICNGVVVK